MYSIASIPAIMAICYYVAEFYKWTITDKNGHYNKKAYAFIPILCGAVGLVLGVVCYYYAPEMINSDNILTASAIGITSGLASVGVHQVKKQINKLKTRQT